MSHHEQSDRENYYLTIARYYHQLRVIRSREKKADLLETIEHLLEEVGLDPEDFEENLLDLSLKAQGLPAWNEPFEFHSPSDAGEAWDQEYVRLIRKGAEIHRLLQEGQISPLGRRSYTQRRQDILDQLNMTLAELVEADRRLQAGEHVTLRRYGAPSYIWLDSFCDAIEGGTGRVLW